MLVAALMKNGDVFAYDSVNTPVIYTMSIPEMESLIKAMEDSKKRKQFIPFQACGDAIKYPDFFNPHRGPILQRRMMERLLKFPTAPGYVIGEPVSEASMQQIIEVPGGR